MTQLRVSLDALKGAQERYLLANAVYTNDRDNLDIQFSGSDTRYPNTKYSLKIRGGYCGIEGTGSTPRAQSNVYCKLETEPQISLWYYLVSGKRMCCNHSINNELGTKICQQETNSYTAYIDTAQKICYIRDN